MSKTLYFLGAGFSKNAGGPIQNEIIKTLLSKDFQHSYSGNKTIMKSLLQFREFLSKELYIPEKDFEKIALEDLFTPIDRCLVDGKSFGTYDLSKLSDFRERLHNLLALSIQYNVDRKQGEAAYIDLFASHINSIAKKRIKTQEDSIAIITTNWDTLLDNILNIAIQKEKDIPLSVVDYCCYISSLEEDHKIKPGLLAIGQGGYNIKYLKLHGSMNWSHCPMCQRLYVKFDTTSMFENNYCKHCKKNFQLSDQLPAIKLKGNLLMPTFLKDLSNIQIRLVWQNAGIELSEASKIVFIGYSLPAADFEIRQLLSRFVRKDAEIKVVLYPGSSFKDKERIDNEIDRYKFFFGSRITADSFIIQTVPEYVSELEN